MPKKLTQEKELEICRLYEEGNSYSYICKVLNTNKVTVYKYLKNNNINLRGGSKRLINNNPFKDLSNPEVQYWLGWLITDGTLHDKRIGLGITEKDIDVIYNYCKFLNIDISNISYKRFPTKNWDTLCTVRFGNKEVFDFLCNLGITPKKSKTLNTSLEFTNDLVRGIIEGDGCIMMNNKPHIVLATSSEVIKNKYINYLNKNSILNSVSCIVDHYQISVSTKQCLKLIKLLYSNAKLYGNRKYQKAIEIIKFYEQKNKSLSCS